MKKNFIIFVSLLAVPLLCCAQDNEYELVWADEFDYTGQPDTAKWNYDLGDGCPDLCGWGNNELQYYTKRPENVRAENGHLIIEARRETHKTRNYTSARILTRNREAWTYGRFEIRAKLPSGRGTWPAIWMLPENWPYGGWPESGEIDIMEHVGHEPEFIYGSVHTAAYNHMEGTQYTDTLRIRDAESAFHVYAIEWTPDNIKWYVNDRKFAEFKNEQKTFKEWPFDKPFHLILNIAVGGNWGGAYGVEENIWPQKMYVDYVRVFQKFSNNHY